MELLQLRYFYESAKNENFAKTAEKYMVPASSISASVKRLEEELGCRLFERRSNRIFLNENGKKLHNSLAVIFDELDGVVEEIKDSKPERSEVRVLILAMREYVSGLILEYQKMHPDVHFVAIFDADNEHSLDYDFIIDKVADIYHGYKRHELGSYGLCFKAVPEHPLIGKELSMRDLRNEKFITLEYELGLNSTLIDCCLAAGFHPNIILQTNDRQCFRNAAEEGIGIGLWIDSNLAPAPERLVNLSITDLQTRRHTLYLYHKNISASEQLKSFADFITARYLSAGTTDGASK